MIRHPLAVLTLALLASACHGAPQAPAANSTAAADQANTFAAKLAALPAAQREGVFMRAISDAGFPCQKIEASEQNPPIEGRPAWSIGCDHGNAYVALASSGEVLQIVPGKPAR